MFNRRSKKPGAPLGAFLIWIRDEYQTDLTFDDSGVRALDDLADRLKYASGERRAIAESGIADFVAEVLGRRHGGTWDRDSGVLTVPRAGKLNVGGWAVKRLHYGRQDSLALKVRVAGELVNPTPEPDWDPDWPEDQQAADDLACALALDPSEQQRIDAQLTHWLSMRRSRYVDATPGLLPIDAALREVQRDLTDRPGDSDLAVYALARRHKAHAWVHHWRFGRSLSGPSAFLVDHSEKPDARLTPEDLPALVHYLAPTPQFREDSLLEMLWRVEKASKFRRTATAEQRRRVAVDLLRLVADAHAWTATKHVKRFLDLVDLDDADAVLAIRDVQSEHWPDYWAVLHRLLFMADPQDPVRALHVGRSLLAWLDGSTGSKPTDIWLSRRQALMDADEQSLEQITTWLDADGDTLRRFPETGEVLGPVSRWVKGARWHRSSSE